MISIGNFFFKYRNILFVFLYLALFIPSPDLFTEDQLGPYYYYWPIVLGLIITITGQAIRGATIGLAYIVRGGKDGQVYADDLVTQGIFRHCRNPLYLGNILMLLGCWNSIQFADLPVNHHSIVPPHLPGNCACRRKFSS
jgi:protein-S-isoprenylcysteine O-methyltransferase Ste14